jgi:hypothetical protein
VIGEVIEEEIEVEEVALIIAVAMIEAHSEEEAIEVLTGEVTMTEARSEEEEIEVIEEVIEEVIKDSVVVVVMKCK